ncbi:MAG: bactofilin family protein [Allosphingosinicella sp.]
MFTRRKPAGLSFIGAELVVSGDITTAAVVHIDGRIDGHVHCRQLCQGASGSVAGNITAEEARIAGLVEGAVSARSLILEATARIKGDITYQTISIAAGAQVDGRLARREALSLAAEDVPEMLTATPIGEAKSTPKADKAIAPPETQDIFSLAPPPQAANG